MTPTLNTNKLHSAPIKAKDGTTVVLTYLKPDAQAMRAMVASIRLRGTKQPSLSLISRRSIRFYLDHLSETRRDDPGAFAAEMQTLERMTAPLCPKTIESDIRKAHRVSDPSALIGLPPGMDAGRSE